MPKFLKRSIMIKGHVEIWWLSGNRTSIVHLDGRKKAWKRRSILYTIFTMCQCPITRRNCAWLRTLKLSIGIGHNLMKLICCRYVCTLCAYFLGIFVFATVVGEYRLFNHCRSQSEGGTFLFSVSHIRYINNISCSVCSTVVSFVGMSDV